VKSARSGVTHVNLNQRFQGLEVFGGHSTVSVGVDGKAVFAAGSFVRDLRAAGSAKATLDALDATDAVEAAAAGLDLAEPVNLHVLEQSDEEAVVSRGGISNAPIPAKLGWQPTKDGLRLAWQVTIDDASAAHLWNAAVDARTGRLLEAADWTSRDSIEDLESTLARSESSAAAASVPFPPNPVLDGSSYRVLQLPTESPNDGSRRLVENPADAFASPFGWHDTDGAPGADFTITRGNNVHAYLDQDDDEQQDFGGSPERRGRPRLRLPGRPDRALAVLPRGRRHQPVLRMQHVPRPLRAVRLRRGRGQLPGGRLRRRPLLERGLRSLRGRGRKRHEQRQLLDARARRDTADADVPLARKPVRKPEPGGRQRGRRVRRELGEVRASAHERRGQRPDRARERRQRPPDRGLRAARRFPAGAIALVDAAAAPSS
jgi:hypothetical protein